jgi:hypothetical protein
MEPIADAVQRELASLRRHKENHITIISGILQADSGNLYRTDLWVNAALNRSWHLLEGFALMVEQRNIACALGLIRLQLDTAMRLFAISLVEEPDAFVARLIGGERLDKMSTRDGKKLTDRFLAQELTKQREWFETVYDNTCDFIHMSGKHIASSVCAMDKSGMIQSFGAQDNHWREEDMLEAVGAFQATTDMILSMAHSLWKLKQGLPPRDPSTPV